MDLKYDEIMKILMIGHTGAGKTSFMAGMYKNLGEKTVGYGIHAVKKEQCAQLKRLAENLEKGIYPAGTDIQSNYQFEFKVGNQVIMPFEWIDYRGGTLQSTNKNDPELTKLVKQIDSCDALIVFLDGTKLVENTWEAQVEYDVVLSCIYKALHHKRTSWLPISFVITKYDTITPDAKLIGLESFTNFFSQCKGNKDVHAMLSYSVVNNKECSSTLYPLLFSIFGGTPNYIKKVEEAEKKYWQEYQDTKPTSFLGKLFSKAEEIVESAVHNVTDYNVFWVTTNDRARGAEASWYENFQLLKILEKESLNMGKKLETLKFNNTIKIYE